MSEAQIRRSIRDFLRMIGCSVWDLEQQRRTRQTPGIADLYVAGHGQVFWVEVKTPKGRLSDAQEVFRHEVTEHGGTVHVWRSVDDAWAWARGLGIVKEAG